MKRIAIFCAGNTHGLYMIFWGWVFSYAIFSTFVNQDSSFFGTPLQYIGTKKCDSARRTMEIMQENTEAQTETSSTPTRLKRRRFTNCERLAMVRNVKRCVAGGGSTRKACRELNISPKQCREWARNITTMSECNPPRAKSCFPGP